jgi:hypothetical protein
VTPCANPLSQTKLQTNGADHRVKIVFPERPKTPQTRRVLGSA